MAFLKKSLSEDSIDRYSHTWAFLFFLVLSIITLFVSLSPTLTLNRSPPIEVTVKLPSTDSGVNSQEGKRSENPQSSSSRSSYPTFKADCWTPNQFTLSMNLYSNTICAGALNSLIRGRNFSAAGIYRPLSGVLPYDQESRTLTLDEFRPTYKEAADSDSADKMKNNESRVDDVKIAELENKKREAEAKMEDIERRREEVGSRIHELVIFKAPLFLFLFAVCLRLPHVIWSLLSAGCGCINVDRTLALVHCSQSLDASRRRKLNEETALSVRKSSKRAAGLTYLLMKLLMVVALCVMTVVTQHCLLGEAELMETRLDTIKSMRNNVSKDLGEINSLRTSINVPTTTATDNDEDKDALDKDLKEKYEDLNGVLLCDFTIRALTNALTYTIQCMMTMIENNDNDNNQKGANPQNYRNTVDPATSASAVESGGNSSESSESKVVLLYKSLFSMVLALLVVLAVSNVLSLGAWLVKLFTSACRSSLGLKSDAFLDAIFLVSMAWLNTPATVAMETASYCSGSSASDGDGASSSRYNGEGEESYKLKSSDDNE